MGWVLCNAVPRLHSIQRVFWASRWLGNKLEANGKKENALLFSERGIGLQRHPLCALMQLPNTLGDNSCEHRERQLNSHRRLAGHGMIREWAALLEDVPMAFNVLIHKALEDGECISCSSSVGCFTAAETEEEAPRQMLQSGVVTLCPRKCLLSVGDCNAQQVRETNATSAKHNHGC